MYYDYLETKMGPLLLAGNEKGLYYIEFQHGKRPVNIEADWQHNGATLKEAKRQLQAYLQGDLSHFDLPLQLRGTDFQKQVWQALQSIPYGETISYQSLAQHIGRPKAMRAVGSANGKNSLCIVIPCHRVIGSNGSLTGYAGGVEIKRWLLQHEQA